MPPTPRRYGTTGTLREVEIVKRLLALLVVIAVALLLASAAACSSGESTPAVPAALYSPSDATTITAAELFATYADKPKAADKRYKDKLLAVTGVVAEVDTDLILDAPELVLSGEVTDQSRGVDCVFDPRYRDQVAALKKGDTMTVLGVCQGSYEVNVLLLHCQPAEE